MIAGIDSDRDLSVYLDPRELIELAGNKIEGKVIKIAYPRQQGNVFVSVDALNATDNGRTVGVQFRGYTSASVGEIELFLSDFTYRELMTKGRMGLRYGTRGSKVNLFDKSKLSLIDRSFPEQLEFYRDNQANLLA